MLSYIFLYSFPSKTYASINNELKLPPQDFYFLINILSSINPKVTVWNKRLYNFTI